MALNNRWGTDEAQATFFRRQAEFRRTMDKIIYWGGHKILAENHMGFKLASDCDNPVDMTKMVLKRAIEPTMKNGDPVTPQIIGINLRLKECHIYFYGPILKEFNGKVAGLVDVVTMMLANRQCDLVAFVSGARGGAMGDIGIVAAHNIVERSMLQRAFQYREGEVHEITIPAKDYEEIFSRTFDSNIWVTGEAWQGKLEV